MAMKIHEGDLVKAALEGKFDVIVHGCNCFCTMGAGIARQIKKTFPAAYAADCQTEKGSKDKLGMISVAGMTTYPGIDMLYVVNAYTQFDFGGDDINVDYYAVRSCMKRIKDRFTGMRIGLPMIGCGLAGGDWKVVTVIIQDELDGEDFTIMYL